MLKEKSIKYIHHTNSLNKYTEIQAKKATKNNKETNVPRSEKVSYYFIDEYKGRKNTRLCYTSFCLTNCLLTSIDYKLKKAFHMGVLYCARSQAAAG